MPPDAAAKSAVMAETMLPAAPVITKDAVLVQHHAGLAIGGGLFLEADGPTLICRVSDLDHTGIAQGLFDQQVGDFGGIAIWFKVDCFDEGIAALPLVRLGKAHHGAAERSDRSAFVVAMMSAKSRRRHDERPRRRRLAHTRVRIVT